jgi:thiamine-phosphate pyrophosphorylase
VTICLVTDRRRLVAAGAAEDAAVRCLLAQVRHATDAGVDLIQIRERDLDAAALAALVREALAAARGTRTRIVVNDRVDVAIACGADGVHLRADSMPPAIVRRLAPPPFLIGRSVHAVGDLAAAQGADYVIAGTVFPSASKPDEPPLLGADGLRAIASAAAAPVLAIGGVTLDRMAEVAAAGASGVAAIGLFMRAGRAPAAACRARALEEVVAHARTRFDSVISRS